jgi:hypothetical protein
MIMCCVFSQADSVHNLVHKLAREHGLAVYDPQSETITYPNGKTGAASEPWWRFW